jgi:3-dehydroquinate synthase
MGMSRLDQLSTIHTATRPIEPIVLRVELGQRSYPIYIGRDLLGRSDLVLPHLVARQVMIVSNETVAPLYLDSFTHALQGLHWDSVILPDGEQYKTWEVMHRIFDTLLEKKHNRTTTLVALGGGVVGDIAGFAAACYQRGVAFIQVPTTLLAQVDSSVGGKTGVNHALGKNMLGAFHQPRCVMADITTLDTLDDRQFVAGLAEVIKYGLIGDTPFFEWLEANIDALLAREPLTLAHAIERSCYNKALIVAADEKEVGRRALLNLGHTFAHAIETATGYVSWLHGEAVAAGMVLAAELSGRMGWLGSADIKRIGALLARSGLPVQPPAEISHRQFLELMAVDKKVIDKNLRFVLLKGIGHAVLSSDVPMAKLQATLEAAQSNGAEGKTRLK